MPQEPSRRALLIGVPHYEDGEIPQLDVVCDDIHIMAAALESSGYLIDTLGMAPGEEATPNRIRRAIQDACRRAEPNEVLLIYFSGHGVEFHGKSYLVPADVSALDVVQGQGLVEINFREFFDASEAGTIICFVDACREGLGADGKGVTSQGWTGGVGAAERCESAIVFGCGPGEQCRFQPGTGGMPGFSYFAQALADVLSSDHPAQTFGQVVEALRTRLPELTRKYQKPPQVLRIVAEYDPEQQLHSRVICDGPAQQLVDTHADIWVQAVRNSALWEIGSVAQFAHRDAFRDRVSSVAAACAAVRCRMGQATPPDAWHDPSYPVRVLRMVEALAARVEGPSLSAAEAAILACAPFVRDGVLSSAFAEGMASADPLSLDPQPGAAGLRYELEKVHQARPDLVRKVGRLREQERTEDAAAVAHWMLHRCIARVPNVWLAQDQGGHLAAELAGVLRDNGQAQAVISEALADSRVLEMAHCVHADPERIERDDRPNSLKNSAVADAWGPHEQVIREKLLAWILSLAGRLAIDVCALSGIVVDHIGLSDPVDPSRLVEMLQKARWEPAGRTRELVLECDHQAIDLALQEYVDHANHLLARIHRHVDEKEHSLDLLTGLPVRLTAGGVRPRRDSTNQPAYETPHLHFEISQNEVRELLMGEQLYGDPTLAFRELYQNALDACRYRQARIEYLRRTGRYEGADWKGRIRFEQSVTHDGRPFVECRDNGIGMGRRELSEAFARAGKRFADMPEFIEEQADWARLDPPVRLYPNSQFGIGVFSYFMLADELEIETCRLDRTGRPGDRWLVTVSGSGSLFRVRRAAGSGDAGTRIRLYLNRTRYRRKRYRWGDEREDARISVGDALREWLWVAEFPTEAVDGPEQTVWEPGHLRGAREAVPTANPDFWWADGNGCVLADGVKTEVEPGLSVINLRHGRRPALSVDRRKPLEWDQGWLRQVQREQIPALLPLPGWLEVRWLWSLEGKNPAAARLLYHTLRRRGAKVRHGSVVVPLADAGLTSLDEYILDRLRDRESLDRDPRAILHAAPPLILSQRIEVWAGLGYEPARGQARALDLPAAPAPIAVPEPGDAVVLRRCGDAFERDTRVPDELPAQVLAAASELDETVGEVLARLNKYQHLGLANLPQAGESADLRVAPEDLTPLSRGLNGRSPFRSGTIPPLHVHLAARRLQEGWEATAARLRRLAGFPSLEITVPDDAALVAEAHPPAVLDGLLGFIDSGAGGFGDVKHIGTLVLLISAKASTTLEAALDAARAGAALYDFGDVSAELEANLPEEARSYCASRSDLVVFSRDCDATWPWLAKTKVSRDHVRKAAARNGETEGETLARLRRLAPLLDLHIPEGT